MEKLYGEIINLLREDARLGVDKIATILGEEEKNIASAIEDMEAQGIIVKYTAICDNDKLKEEKVEALIEVRVTPQKMHGFDAIAEEIYSFDEVKSVYLMSGGYDLAVFVEGKSLKEVALFVSERLSVMDTVVSTATHFILKKYKVEGVLIKKEEENNRLAVHA